MTNSLRSIILLAILCTRSTTAHADVFYDTYQRGLAFFKIEDYVDARSEFLRAYGIRHEPIILFNIAQTFRLEARLEANAEQALIYYRRFLAEPKISEDLRKEAQTYVTALEATLRAHRSEFLNSATRRNIAFGTISFGAIALATGTVLGISAKGKQSDAHALCPDPGIACSDSQTANSLIRLGHNLAIGANVAFGIGTAAAVTGSILWFTSRPESFRIVSIIPAISRSDFTISAQGRF